ncbi:hypothetical protein M514_07134 [Trichuris suis]|nr:hypothetical protein M514_07134 [Trichuris suis]
MDFESVDKVVKVVFDQVQPMVAIFSTPNAELNVALGLQPGQFRHSDHMFEWTREQFSTWCTNVVGNYPDYRVEHYGIGSLDSLHTSMYGHCSQFALFTRKSDARRKTVTSKLDGCPSDMHPFVEVYRVDFWLRLSSRLLYMVKIAVDELADVLIAKHGGPVDDEFNGIGRWIPVDELHKCLSIRDYFQTAGDLSAAMYSLGFAIDLRSDTVFLSAFEQ